MLKTKILHLLNSGLTDFDAYKRAIISKDRVELARLAEHSEPFVRARAAANTAISSITMEALCRDEYQGVLANLVGNRAARPDIIYRISRRVQGMEEVLPFLSDMLETRKPRVVI